MDEQTSEAIRKVLKDPEDIGALKRLIAVLERTGVTDNPKWMCVIPLGFGAETRDVDDDSWIAYTKCMRRFVTDFYNSDNQEPLNFSPISIRWRRWNGHEYVGSETPEDFNEVGMNEEFRGDIEMASSNVMIASLMWMASRRQDDINLRGILNNCHEQLEDYLDT